MTSKVYTSYCGIDVSKEWLDFAVDKLVLRIKQDESEIMQFIHKHLAGKEALLCVLESTGGYENLVAQCLVTSSIAVHVAHPSKVVAFAKAKGKLAKTDSIDAKTLQEYGQFIQQDELRAPLSKAQFELQELGSRLAQLKANRHQEICRIGIVQSTIVQKTLSTAIKFIEKQICKIEAAIEEIINNDEQLKTRHKMLRSMKGVGKVLATIILTDLPELGSLNRKQIAALVGVAPITKQSGKWNGVASTKYGRTSVRRVLYMAALTASKYNTKMQQFYNRLREAGKPAKVALVAVMRKMIVTLNAMVYKQVDYVN